MKSSGTDFKSIGELNESVVTCRRCPRLVEFRETVLSGSKRYEGEKFWRRPITGFGDRNARLLVVGLAPAASGANRTGRVFTGDKSSEILVSSFHQIGLSNLDNSVSADDGLEYRDLFLTLAVRCVPPDNRPSNEEMLNCLPYLEAEMKLLVNTKSIVALGVVAFNSLKSIFGKAGHDVSRSKFVHGKFYTFGHIRVYCCYHPSPRNINTGRTTPEDITRVLREAYDFSSS